MERIAQNRRRTTSAGTRGVWMLVLLAARSVAQAGAFEDAAAAYERRDFAAAYRLVQPLAAQGDPPAAELLGRMYDQGHGVASDPGLAFQWWLRAAAGGSARAQQEAGGYALDGLRVERDVERGLALLRQASAQGDGAADGLLGAYYRARDPSTAADLVTAAEWFQKGAERGDGKSQDALGTLYGHGWGVPRDLAIAYQWFSLSASHPWAFQTDAAARRDQLGREMTRLELARARKRLRPYHLP